MAYASQNFWLKCMLMCLCDFNYFYRNIFDFSLNEQINLHVNRCLSISSPNLPQPSMNSLLIPYMYFLPSLLALSSYFQFIPLSFTFPPFSSSLSGFLSSFPFFSPFSFSLPSLSFPFFSQHLCTFCTYACILP